MALLENNSAGLVDWNSLRDNLPSWDTTKATLMGKGLGTATRGLGGAGLGYLLGRALGDHGKTGAILGGLAGLTPEIMEYAPKVIDAVKGLFNKNAAAMAAVRAPMHKQAALGAAALLAAHNMTNMGHNNVDVNAIKVPEGALPPEALLLPEVKREGSKAAVKSLFKNVGLGTLIGGGGGALLGALAGDDGKKKETAAAAALLGAVLGGGGGMASAIWNVPDDRLAAMKAKHNELHGIG